MVNRVITFASVVAAIILVSMLFFTSPANIGPIGIFIFFSMSYIVFFGLATLVVYLFMRFVFRKREMTWRNYTNAAIIAFWPIMVLVIISVGASNIFIPIICATISVALFMFLLKKV